jgi:tetratricopeptide (TPR) repeat protein
LPALRVQLYIYEESASFILFLIDHYGLEKLKQLYQASRTVIPRVAEDFRRIYGKDLTIVEQDWHRFLESYAVGQEARAQYLTQAMINYVDRIPESFSQLEEYWNRFPFLLVSPSAKVSAEEYELLGPLLLALGCSSNQGMTRNDADDAYEAFDRALTAVESSLATWLEAVHTFEAALNSMAVAEMDDYDFIITKLKEAQALYREVGDEGMVTRTGEYIVAFQNLCKGKTALMDGDHVSAEALLSRALEFFSKLDEQQMARQVSRLLEFSRCVLMQ